MANTPVPVPEEKEGLFQKFLDIVEIIGNKFPSPFVLFCILGVIILIVGGVLDGTSASFVGKGGKMQTVKITSLLNADGFRFILTDMVKNFINFPPLGLVLTMTLALGLAESTGMIGALVRKMLLGVPGWAITAMIFFIGINGNIASDASMVFVPAAAAAVYASMGKNPILGMSAAFAATSAGFSANVLPAGTDALLAGITQSVINNVPATANCQAHPLMNYYFMSTSVLILLITGTIIAEKIVGPRLDKLEFKTLDGEDAKSSPTVTPEENRGLRFAGLAALSFIVVLCLLTLPTGALLRDPKTGNILPSSPFVAGIIPILFCFFFIIGVSYGIGRGNIQKESDVPKYMAKGLEGVLSFMVTGFAAGQFVAWFNKSNVATVVAVRGAEFLQSMNFTGIGLIISLILLSSFVDLFVISGSSKWIILAPIFIPMFGLLGYEPALTQAAYRIGESSVNTVTPLNYYVPVMFGIMAKYLKDQKHVGMGTLMATQIPYALGFLVVWSLYLFVFIALDLPLGPGCGIYIR